MAWLAYVLQWIFPKTIEMIIDEEYRHVNSEKIIAFMQKHPWIVRLWLQDAKTALWNKENNGIKYLCSLDGKALAQVTDGGTVTFYKNVEGKEMPIRTYKTTSRANGIDEVNWKMREYGWNIA